jgi:hypothetical protein
MALDHAAPHLMASVLVSPALVGTRASAQLLEIAADGANFAGPEVLRACVRMCDAREPSSSVLARALLRQPHLGNALGPQRNQWLVELLQEYGSTIWPDIAEHVTQSFDGEAAAAFVDAADLTSTEVAAFLASYLDLFTNSDDHIGIVPTLLGHDDWRVRAAVADGMARMHPAAPAVASGMALLSSDHDYKVRSSAARVLRHVSRTFWRNGYPSS